jgi:hypothetical protein
VIVSHEHRYVFVQMPHTGSTAVASELIENYGGEHVLWKHAHYSDFLRAASADERRYFAFTAIRHPLDEAVSIYTKIKTDHQGRMTTNADAGVSRKDRQLHRWISDSGADFGAFLRRAYRMPYDKWLRGERRRFDYVMRFEALTEDFASVLQRLGIQPVRPLPWVNRTGGRETDFTSYYTPQIRPRARAIFGPYMLDAGFEFPEGWTAAVPLPSRLLFRALAPIRRLYWGRIKWLGRRSRLRGGRALSRPLSRAAG